MTTKRVAVIGAGIVGVASATYLRLHLNGQLFASRSESDFATDETAMALRRANRVAVLELGAEELRQHEPELSRDYVRALAAALSARTAGSAPPASTEPTVGALTPRAAGRAT